MTKKVSKKVTKKNEVTEAQNNDLTETEPQAPEAEGETTEEEKTPAKKIVVADFDPKKLRSIGANAWVYTDDVKKITRATFHQQRAKDFGIKENDIVFVVLNGKVETLGV